MSRILEEKIEKLKFTGAVDADGHILEAEDLWEKYCEPKYRSTAVRLKVDDQTITELSSYRADTPLMTLWLPEENMLGSAARVAESVADGYQVMLSPLSAGEHVVTMAIPGPQPGETLEITYKLTVVDPAAASQS